MCVILDKGMFLAKWDTVWTGVHSSLLIRLVEPGCAVERRVFTVPIEISQRIRVVGLWDHLLFVEAQQVHTWRRGMARFTSSRSRKAAR